jgi:hypothetical protein
VTTVQLRKALEQCVAGGRCEFPVSHLALIGLRPPAGSLHQCGMRPQRKGSSVISPVL